MDFFSPQIWTVGPSYPILEELVVIGPYPSPEFFRTILDRFPPRKLTLVVDGACELGILDAVRSLCPQDNPPEVRFGWCNGMVHAKLYYLRWKQPGNASCVSRLIWGSLNASQNGFTRNAETLSHVTLPSQKAVTNYFQAFQQDSGSVSQLAINIANSVMLVLPGFSFTNDRVAPQEASFESWVQSGVLCHRYERDSSFLRFTVRLKKALPADFIGRVIGIVGIAREREGSDTFRYKYIPERGVSGTARWRGKLFLPTCLGFWTSSECYRLQGCDFRGQGLKNDVRISPNSNPAM